MSRISRVFVLLLFISVIQTSWTFEVHEASDGYMVDRWGVEDGIPGAQLLSIAQTTDGYIWVGTYYGLARFDGLGFTVFDAQVEGLPPGPTFGLKAGLNGDLWIIKQGRLVQYSKGKFKTIHNFWDDSENGQMGSLKILGVTKLGVPLVELKGAPYKSVHIFSFEDGTLKRVVRHSTEEGRIWNSVLDVEDRIWFRSGEQLGMVTGGQWEPKIEIPPSVEGLLRLIPSQAGGIWGSSQKHVFRFLNDQWMDVSPKGTDELSERIVSLAENSDGNLWVKTTDKKLTQLLTGEKGHLVQGNVILDVPTGKLMFDFNGGIWVASPSADSCLNRYRLRTFWNFTKTPELAGMIRCFAQKENGDLLISTGNNLYSVPESDFTDLQHLNVTPQLIPSAAAWTMMVDSSRRFLGGRYSQASLKKRRQDLRGSYFTLDQQGQKRALMPTEIGTEFRITAMCEGETGEIWLGTLTEGLIKIVGEEVFKFGKEEGFDLSIVHALVSDKQGRIWIGTSRYGLFRFADGEMTQHLKNLQVRSLLIDDEDTLWAGTSGSGVFRFRGGDFFQFNRSHGLPVNDLNTIVDDGLGNLWFGSYRGVHRIRKSHFESVASGKSKDLFPNSFTLADGLSSMQCPTGHPAGYRTRDGKLWFATVQGVNVVDPKTIDLHRTVNDPIVENVFIDGDDVVGLSPSKPIHVGASASRVEFRYTVISLRAREEIRFRYRLKGYDHDWIDAGRQRSATYNHIGTGQYVFEVMAADSAGDWIGGKTQLLLHVQGPIWKSVPFQISVVLGMFLVAGGIVFIRSRRQSQRQAIRSQFTKDVIDNQEADRRRIARELHDSLEQNLLVIKNQAIMSAKNEGVSPELKTRLEDISEISSSSIEEVRQIANNLRPYQIDRLGLSKAIEGMLNKISDASGLEIERFIDDIPKSVSSDLQMNVYRIIQEALNNTIKHAEATKVLLTLVIGEDALSLQIKDNGKGFNIESVRNLMQIEGHGLRGIEERVNLFDGHCELHSSIGSGAEWDIRIPLR